MSKDFKLSEIRKRFISGDALEEDLTPIQNTLRDYLLYVNAAQEDSVDQIRDAIYICLDCYTNHPGGKTIISDEDYDVLMNHYIRIGNDPIIYPDKVKKQTLTSWEHRKHSMPGMVGSLKKAYTLDEISDSFEKMRSLFDDIIIVPKYDGVSCVIEMKAGNVYSAVTRGDGDEGQDITRLARHIKTDLISKEGFYKCELCIGMEDFKKLIEEKPYANRRSATSGIINSPKNIDLARYITAIPLIRITPTGKLKYIGYHHKDFKKTIPLNAKLKEIIKEINSLFDMIKESDFPYRTDGVVLYPVGIAEIHNESDFLEHAIAFKKNTSSGKTRAVRGYVSIGRKGNAVPMLEVEPVEVNETVVTNVSLGSFDKYAEFDIHENEDVIIYSAGDVIPQVKIPEDRSYPKGAKYLEIKKICPYCGVKLNDYGKIYRCDNPECIRNVTGPVITFLITLGVENTSDKTVEMMYEAGLIKSIQSLFSITEKDLLNIHGFGEISASKFIQDMKMIRENEITLTKLITALGILHISEKRCREILKFVTMDMLLHADEMTLISSALGGDLIGMKVAEEFTAFILNNRDLLNFLFKEMNITTKEEKFYGEVAFSGFRDSELEARVNKMGYVVSTNVNHRTIALLSSATTGTTKVKAAQKKGIPIFHKNDEDEFFKMLEEDKKDYIMRNS